MDDLPPFTPDAPRAAQRSHGAAAVALATPEGRVRLTRLAQSGSAKAFLPRCYGPAPEIVFLNTSGGLTGGDSLSYALDLADGSRATATTQTAERAYAAGGRVATLDVRLRAGPGAALHWLPQETILYDAAALHRRTRLDLAEDAHGILLETVVLGRTAMGERVRRLDFADRREIYVAGRPVLIDPLALDTSMLARAPDPAGLAGALALATLVSVGPGAEATLAGVRAALHDPPAGVQAAASAWSGKLVVRALSTDARALRRTMADCLRVLTGGAVPRVWAI